MSTTVCLYNYEYNGQVYSPAFSDPPSPKDYNPDSEEDADETTLSPPATPKSQKSNSVDSNYSYKSKKNSSCLINNQNTALPSTKDIWKNKLKRKSSEIDGNSNCHSDKSFHFVNKKPKYPTKYHEMLQPLSPYTTLSTPTSGENKFTEYKHSKEQIPSTIDVQLQEKFNELINSSLKIEQEQISFNDERLTREVEEFLTTNSASIDINRYNEEGQTPLQRCCLEGNLALAKLLVKFGAKSKMTTRDGFTTLHVAAFSGHSQILFYIMSIKS